jgi:MATE family multidrug resistance protein
MTAALLADARRELRPLTALAAPIIAGLTASTGIMVVDTAMLGPLGATPLAAASLTTSVLIVFYAGLYGFVGPVGLLTGRAHGAGDAPRIGAIARHGAVLASLGGAAAAALMAAALPALAHLGQPPAVVAALPAYWLWMAAGLPPYALALSGRNLLDATDRAWTGVALSLPPIALNALLNWLLIYGRWGFPELGLTGAGVASFIATAAGAGLVWAWARYAPDLCAWWAPTSLTRAGLAEQLRDGMPMAWQYVLEGASVAVAGLLVGVFGAVALAGNQIALAVGATLYMLPLGAAAAVGIRVAQAVGGGGQARVAAIAAAGLGAVTLWMTLVAAAFILGGSTIARLFTRAPDVVAEAAAILLVFGFMQLMDGVQSVSLGALRGLLDTRWPTRVSLIAYWLIALPLGWIVARYGGFGAAGVWAGFGAGLTVAAAALSWRLVAQIARADESAATSARKG